MKPIFHINKVSYLTTAVKSARISGSKTDPSLCITFVDGDCIHINRFWGGQQFFDLCTLFEVEIPVVVDDPK